MEYFQVKVPLQKAGVSVDQLIAYLADAGFEGFEETGEQLIAYFPASTGVNMTALLSALSREHGFAYEAGLLQDQNWNALWESQYEPVQFGQECLIRAPFHKPLKEILYDIVIEPKMSFGTAHHETTFLMIEEILTLDCNHKKILDMGCGTAVLAILASKMGAVGGLAIDNDEWAYRNAEENLMLNKVKNIEIKLGSLDLIRDQQFDMVFANITRNILLDHLPGYAETLQTGGVLLLSGFYDHDGKIIKQTAGENRLHCIGERTKNSWMMLKFVKENKDMA